ncbi:MAG: helix-turn-helix domain-containing protein [Rhodothermaceae bacterium]|nr:helix-turn-helix domain-containing protein [Rhodothermaceae bacterium]
MGDYQLIILVLGCLGVAQALFLSAYLLTLKRGNRAANIFLGLVLLGLTIRIGKAVVFNYTYLDPWVRNMGISGFLLVGPAVWLYGQALLNNVQGFSKTGLLHVAPFVLFALSSKLIPNDGSLAAICAYTAVLAHLAGYLIVSWTLYARASSKARSGLLSWYRGILIGVSLILVLYAGIFVGVVPFYLLGATAFSFLIYLFSFVFLKKHHLALEKYAQSTVDVAASKALIIRVKDKFTSDAPYLDPDTSLQSIAQKLDTQPRFLSQAINEVEKVNFSEFVNRYRVEHAKSLLTDPDRAGDKIATIAFDCGFGNLTSFNVAFKTHVNMTPSQFRKQNTSVENMK